MKKLSFFLVSIVSLMLIACDPVPQEGHKFVDKYYPDYQIIECDKDDDGGYDLKLTGDVEIDLDRDGEWTSVEDDGGVPDEIIPVHIRQYVHDNYMGRTIVKIEREYYGYYVELYHKIKMRFDHQGNFMELVYNKVVYYD